MSVRCPDGHTSESTDYCDICGLPIEAAAPSSLDLGAGTGAIPGIPPTTPVPTGGGAPGGPAGGLSINEKSCPNCQSIVPAADLFCEVCGYDFTTDTAPAPVTAEPEPEPEPAPPAVVVEDLLGLDDGEQEWC